MANQIPLAEGTDAAGSYLVRDTYGMTLQVGLAPDDVGGFSYLVRDTYGMTLQDGIQRERGDGSHAVDRCPESASSGSASGDPARGSAAALR